ncbi:MAG: SDR family NAD(P)-dependent oxidoreductase [Deltaproteobacteria bacterium]|nr:SDR family NAD(P)-dependent oxidoreductase [Deltaproteobacteria bacterium]MBW2446393.1 SDR family NAD(P)-dependent oxidoreductase [Deltaproteobacteria bacterium]
MKILVTGGTGFIGSHTAVALAAAGHEVRLLVRTPEKAKRVFEALEADLPECVVGDITDAASVETALSGCDGTFHAAALVALEARQAEAVARTNFDGTRNVVGQAHRMGLEHIVYVSSTSALFDPEGGMIGPDSEPASVAGSVYSKSKAETEVWLRKLQAGGAPVSASYPGAVLGPHAPELTELHRSLPLQLRLVPITSGGINFVDVRDLAAIHRAAFERPPEAARWIAGGAFLTWSDLADLLEEITGRRIRRIRASGPLMRGLGRVGDAVKRVVPFGFPLTYEAMTTATRWPGVDSSRTLVDLDVSFRELRETLADTIVWMHAAGHIGAAPLGRLAPSRS